MVYIYCFGKILETVICLDPLGSSMEPDAPDRDEGTGGFVDRVADATRVVVVGGGQAGRRLAEQLAPDRSVHHVDEDPTAVGRPQGYEANHAPDVTSTAALASTGVTAEDVAVVLAGRDSRTLLVTQLLRTAFGVERVYAVLTDPRNEDAFDIAGVTVVCGAGAVADAVLASSASAVTSDRPDVASDAVADVSDTPEPG
jgi:Trk K+ transport system NAD-binding subunit